MRPAAGDTVPVREGSRNSPGAADTAQHGTCIGPPQVTGSDAARPVRCRAQERPFPTLRAEHPEQRRDGVAARNAMIDPLEAAETPFLRAPERLHGGATPGAANHAWKCSLLHCTVNVKGRIAGAEVFHVVDCRFEALHFPDSCLSRGRCFPKGKHATIEMPERISQARWP